MSLIEFMEAADLQLQESLKKDLDDYFSEIQKTEIIWMSIFILVLSLLFFLIFYMNLLKKFREIEIMNFVLNKLVLIPKGK